MPDTSWVLGYMAIVMGGFCVVLWILYGYPVWAMLKHEKIELKKKQIELEILKRRKR